MWNETSAVSNKKYYNIKFLFLCSTIEKCTVYGNGKSFGIIHANTNCKHELYNDIALF